MTSLYKIFDELENRGNEMLSLMKKHSFSYKKTKEVKTWTLTEVSNLVNRSSETIRINEKNGKLKKATISKTNNKREYSIKDINEIRNFFKTSPKKPNNVSPAVIAFTNFKGGVAKTTSAVHCAHFLARYGYKVLFIDSDNQASATAYFGYEPDNEIKKSETLFSFFANDISNIKSLIKKTNWDNLDLIPANLGLYSVELELPAIRERSFIQTGEGINIYGIINKGIKQVSNNYDIIIIDCPPAMSILNVNAIYAANALIIPCPPELPDIASMFQSFSMIKDITKKITEINFSFIKILITKNDGNKSSLEIVDALRRIYGSYILRAEMMNSQAIKQTRADIKSIYEVKNYKGPKSTLLRAVQMTDKVNKEIKDLIEDVWNLTNFEYKQNK